MRPANETCSRRDMLKSSLAAGALPLLARSAIAETGSSFRNVLLLIADDHGLDMPSYGNPSIQTPNLERLAAAGVRFSNTYCTTPSCSASRSVILTGLHNHLNGQFGHAHDFHHFIQFPWVRPIPFLLKRHGYRTGVIGKLHVVPDSIYPFDFKPKVNSRNVTAMAQKADEFFGANRDAPFFLLVGFSDPHRSREGFGNEDNKSDLDPVIYSPDAVKVPDFLSDRPEVRAELVEYAQSVTRMDQGVGLILKALEKHGKDKDTLVIYISDNGIAFPGAKTCLYDPGIHLPGIVRSPTQTKRGIVNNAMVSFTDLAPTILDWTGAAPPDYPLHGRSILPILEEENPSGWDEIYFSHTFHEITMYYPSRGIRTRRYKYIHNLAHELPFPFASDLYAAPTWQGVLERGDRKYGPRSVKDYMYRAEEELYDLENDPDEVKNLARKRKYRTVLNDLRTRTLDFRRRTKDPWLILNNYTDPTD